METAFGYWVYIPEVADHTCIIPSNGLNAYKFHQPYRKIRSIVYARVLIQIVVYALFAARRVASPGLSTVNARNVMKQLCRVGLPMILTLAGCSSVPPGPAVPLSVHVHRAGTSAIRTVFLIVMENHNWSDIQGSAAAPYINRTLLPQASYTERYYNPPGLHPSLPNYLWLEAGTNFGVTSDLLPDQAQQTSTAHLTFLLRAQGISWRAYEQGIGSRSCPLLPQGAFAPRHDATLYFRDVTENVAYCRSRERPYAELAGDLARNRVARYNVITPDLCHDMHDTCPPLDNSIAQGDRWLASAIPPILRSQAYRKNGAIFITWDEGEGGDGPIGMIVLSPRVRAPGYTSYQHFTHSSTLRTLEEIFTVRPFLGDAKNASDLRALFKSGTLTPHAGRHTLQAR